MAQRSVKDILHRSKKAWKIKDNWKSLYEDAYDLVLPGLNPYRDEKENPKPMNRQFDSTATKSAIRLANRLLQDLTPPDDNWIQVRTGPALDLELKDDKGKIAEVNKLLSSVSRLANMVVNQGEMVDARGMAFLDMVITGMGVLLDREDASDRTNPMVSQCVSQSEIAIEIDGRGQDVGFYRNRDITVDDIETLWSDATIPASLEKIRQDDVTKKVRVHEVNYLDRDTNKWRYEILYVVDENDSDRIFAEELDVCPWTIFRWLRLPGVPYGPGPILLLLPDIRTANKIIEMILKNAALALAGMYMARDDGVLNPENIMITPGAIIPVASTGGSMGASIEPLPVARNFDIGQLVLELIQKRIRAGLYDDSLPEVSGNPRSATEIINRVRELTQDIGGAIGRLTSDTVQYGRKVVSILAKNGFVPEIKIDQFTIKMQVNSPLANAQQMREVEVVTQWLQTIVLLAGPEAARVIAKREDIAVWMADRMGVPADLVNDPAEQQQVKQEIMAEMAMAQQPAAAPMQQAA